MTTFLPLIGQTASHTLGLAHGAASQISRVANAIPVPARHSHSPIQQDRRDAGSVTNHPKFEQTRCFVKDYHIIESSNTVL